MKNKIELGLVALVVATIGWSAWNPAEWNVWWMEMVWVLSVFALLLATAHKFRFSTTAYALVAIWLVMHTIGAHYTFEHVPFGWVTDLFGFSRNHYDRVAHFGIGLNSFMLAELFYRKRWITNRTFAAFTGVIAIMAMACAWEIIEWAVAVWDGGEDGMAFLGSQGDIWDAQKDMLADTLGAICAAVLFCCCRKTRRTINEKADVRNGRRAFVRGSGAGRRSQAGLSELSARGSLCIESCSETRWQAGMQT